MKLWKSKEEKRAEAASARQQVLDGLREKFDDAQTTPDAAEKLEKLEHLREAVDAVEKIANAAIHSKSTAKLVLPYFAVTFGSLGAAAVTIGVLAAAPALMVLPMLPAIVGGMYLGEKRGAAFRARQQQELKPFFDALKQQQADISTATAETIGVNIRTLAASPKFDALHVMPGLREHFMTALQKTLSDVKEPGVTLPKNDGTGFRL
ncbi:MAG: hypothetical protein IT560_01315 [Alphaproteobacteria bacterium]|nr:hypothetical protein [Alphaproteobacteria bacterium]